ncbi:MAG: hypothetical protein KDB90_05535 [Planctomycetes bacterium]|nr:hypothetical protein [Planctomycetota bacterium]
MPKSVTEKIVECRTPGGLTLRMERWYYEAIRSALLRILPAPDIHAEVYQLHLLVNEQLDAATRGSINSLVWLVAWVRLDLEVEGVVTRDAVWVKRVQGHRHSGPGTA